MPKTHPTHPRWTQLLQYLALGTLSVAGAFTLGLETAGEVHPFATSEAAVDHATVVPLRVPQKGDMDDDDRLTTADAVLLLELSEGWQTATPREIRQGDLDGDFRLTSRDVLRLLRTLSSL